MDFETLATIPEQLEQTVGRVTNYIPEELSRVIEHAYSYFPTQIDPETAGLFMLYFAAASLIMSVLSRIALGRRSSLNHSLSSAMGIFLIYALTAVIYTFQPWRLIELLSPLPFVTFAGEYLIVLPFSDTMLPALCSEILSLVILAFLVNLLDTFTPRGNSLLGWYLLRFLTVGLSMVLHYLVCWAFRTYLPEVLVTYAPGILLAVLVLAMLSGILSLIIGLVVAVTNPFLGAMYTFFFSNVFGKQLSKAVFSSAIVCAVFYLMDYFGYTVITIATPALMAYIPLALLLLVLWYLIGHVL